MRTSKKYTDAAYNQYKDLYNDIVRTTGASPITGLLSKEEWVTAVKAKESEYRFIAEARDDPEHPYHARSITQLNKEVTVDMITGTSKLQRKTLRRAAIKRYNEEQKTQKIRINRAERQRRWEEQLYNVGEYKRQYDDWKEQILATYDNMSEAQKAQLGLTRQEYLRNYYFQVYMMPGASPDSKKAYMAKYGISD